LQGAIAACHARASSTEDTDWARIAVLYGELAQLKPSPVVELNRAVAVGMAFGPAAGLVIADALQSEPSLKTTPAAERPRRSCSSSAGWTRRTRGSSARPPSRNARQREMLLERAAACR
jgi:predicted RNA polymerase sigma factor